MRASRFLALGIAATALVPAATLHAPASAATKPKLQDVGKATSAASTMAFSMDAFMTFNVKGKAVSGHLVATGQTDRANKASSITMDMAEFMKSMAAGSGQPLPKELSDPALFKMQVIGLGTKVYMSFPMLNVLSKSANTKPWVVVDATSLGVSASDIAASQGADPAQGLDYLKGIAGDAKTVGTETIDGVSTTHYSGIISKDALLAKLTPAQAAKLSTAFGAATSIPVDVWVDDQGRARRMDMTMRMNAQGTDVTMKATYRFSKFGEPVKITAPPASQVATAEESPALAAAIKQAAAQQAAAKKAAA